MLSSVVDVVLVMDVMAMIAVQVLHRRGDERRQITGHAGSDLARAKRLLRSVVVA